MYELCASKAWRLVNSSPPGSQTHVISRHCLESKNLFHFHQGDVLWSQDLPRTRSGRPAQAYHRIINMIIIIIHRASFYYIHLSLCTCQGCKNVPIYNGLRCAKCVDFVKSCIRDFSFYFDNTAHCLGLAAALFLVLGLL